MVAAVCYIDASGRGTCDAIRLVEAGDIPMPDRVSGDPVSGDRPNMRPPVEYPDGVVLGVGDPDVTGSVNRHVVWVVEPRDIPCPVYEAGCAKGVASQKAYVPVGVNLADLVVLNVGHIEVPRAVVRDAAGSVEPCVVCSYGVRTVVAGCACKAGVG